jgi:hypothetical protein
VTHLLPDERPVPGAVRPGFSATLRKETLRDYEFPHGAVWQELAGTVTP